MNLCSRTQERKIEKVSVKRRHDGRLHVLNMREETLDSGRLRMFSKDLATK